MANLDTLTTEESNLVSEFEADIAATMSASLSSTQPANAGVQVDPTGNSTANIGGAAPGLVINSENDPWLGQQLPQGMPQTPQTMNGDVGNWNNFRVGNFAPTQDHRQDQRIAQGRADD